jgi:hypothetical protein
MDELNALRIEFMEYELAEDGKNVITDDDGEIE